MSEKPQGSEDAPRGADDRLQATEEGSKEKESLAPEDGATPKKSRGLLHVPSRSSSQRIQPSPTSTGLSGATASDPRERHGWPFEGIQRKYVRTKSQWQRVW